MRLSHLLFFGFCLAFPVARAQEPAASTLTLEAWLLAPDLWQTKSAELLSRVPEPRFRWTSQAQDSARGTRARFGPLAVPEVVARFQPDASLGSVSVLVYSHGDSRPLAQAAFSALVVQVANTLAEATKAKPERRPATTAGGAPILGVNYRAEHTLFILEYSSTPENRGLNQPFRGDFIRIRLEPAAPRTSGLQAEKRSSEEGASGANKPVSKAVLAARVQKTPGGATTLPGVPMVNQGPKGYCVNASVERVLRYYGLGADMHDIAQAANSTAGGTSSTEMTAALKKLAIRFRVNFAAHVQLQGTDYQRIIEEYNRALRLAKPPPGSPLNAQGSWSDVGAIYAAMDGRVLRDARTRLNPAALTQFQKTLQSNLERGLPLLWTVILGVLPEGRATPQGTGGHMRLIIGLDPAAATVTYSDSWGAGHEQKTMPLTDAWTITTGLFTLTPLN